jgi:phage terminase Nu1 subunit (DNA packaging protein)
VKVNKATLSDVLGVSEASLTEWQKESPPLPLLAAGARRGQANTYETAAVIEWLIQRRMSNAQIEDPRDRLYRLQAQEAELRIAEKKGQLVNVAQLEPRLVQMVAAFRVHMLNLADRIVDDLGDIHNVVIDRELVEGWVRGALEELSEYDPEVSPRPQASALPSESEVLTSSPTEVLE